MSNKLQYQNAIWTHVEKNFMPIFLTFLLLFYHILTVFPLCRLYSNRENMGMKIFFQVSPNNVLILQFVTPQYQDHVPPSIYADIFRRLGSGTNFRQSSTFSRIQQYSFSNLPERQKYTDFGLTLQPTTARYTRIFSTIWVSIDLYFFGGKH